MEFLDCWKRRRIDGDIEGRMISEKNRHGVFAFNLRRELTEPFEPWRREEAWKREESRECRLPGKFNNNSLSLSRNFQLCAD